MMSDLATRIQATTVQAGSIAIFWLAQAGFVYKTPGGTVIYVDAYLTDCVERLYGFKRLMGSPISAEEVKADFVVSTHAHEDHLDIDAIPILARTARTRFVGAADCQPKYQMLGLSPDRYTIVHKGESVDLADCRLTAVAADHGAQTPHALGVVLNVGNVKVWQVGDTAYRPDLWQDIFALGIDVIIPPINGAFGNLDGVEAAKLAHDAQAKVAIPCHFWMFAEHNGNPAQFLAACKDYAPDVKPLLLSQGEKFVYSR